ncbi:MAG: nitrogenase component 1 [bacterium]
MSQQTEQNWLPQHAQKDCLKDFENIFGLGESGLHSAIARVASVEKHGREFRVTINISAAPPLTLWIMPFNESHCHFKTKQLNINLEEERLSSRSKDFLEELQKNLKDVRIEDMERIFIPDEKLMQKTTTDSDGAEIARIKLTDFGAWRLSSRWRQFFFEEDIEGDIIFDDGYAMSGKCCVIQHTDFECAYVRPPSFIKFADFYNTFWGSAVVSPHSLNYKVTILREIDVIMGGGKKLEKVLDIVAADKNIELLNIVTSCVPMLIGDDVEAATDRFRELTCIPVITTDMTTKDALHLLAKVLVQIIQKNPAPLQQKSYTYNLAGFTDRRDCREMIDMLADAGMELNECFFPTVAPERLKNYAAAAVQVFLPVSVHEPIYSALEKLPIKAIRPGAPHGIAGTFEWMRTIAAALGREEEFVNSWERHLRAQQPAWNKLLKEAKKYRLGFVVDTSQMELLVKPEIFTIIPLLRSVEEMGFGIDIMYYDTSEASHEVNFYELQNILKHPETLRIRKFNSIKSLHTLLRDDSTNAVFTKFFFDKRLTRNGTCQFSFSTFEMGLQGALRTLERLVTYCRLPFYRKYAKYLASNPSGDTYINP